MLELFGVRTFDTAPTHPIVTAYLVIFVISGSDLLVLELLQGRQEVGVVAVGRAEVLQESPGISGAAFLATT